MKRILHTMMLVGIAGFCSLALLRGAQVTQTPAKPQVATDPQTGRAIGAKEIVPDELRKLIAQKVKMMIIDVRDEAQFEKETIKGAVYVPFADLEASLKEIPKDTILVFT